MMLPAPHTTPTMGKAARGRKRHERLGPKRWVSHASGLIGLVGQVAKKRLDHTNSNDEMETCAKIY